MIIREVVNGIQHKPFVVNWSEMSKTYVITAKTKTFRSPEQVSSFINSLRYREGFIKVNHVYCRDNGWYLAHYA